MIIQCPECGHNVSDKAPMCPGCGVEIAGHIWKCPHCGTYHLDSEQSCTCQADLPSHTRHANEQEQPVTAQAPADIGPAVVVQPIDETTEAVAAPLVKNQPETPRTAPRASSATNGKTGQEAQGSGRSTLIVSFLIAALICATMLYFYKDATEKNEAAKEQMANQQASPEETIPDETEQQALEEEKTDANKRQDEKLTTDQVADSTDWIRAKTLGTKESYKRYLTLHPEGKYSAQAEAAVKKLTEAPLSQAESQKAFNSVRNFFIAINKNDREALSAAVAPVLTSFEGKTAAQKSEVIQYMVDLYQADVKNLNWHLGNVTNIKKLPISDDRYEYEVIIPAKRVTERESATSTIEYIVRATVNPDGKVSSMKMTRK